MSELFNLLSAFGLSTSAGLNAYLPLLIVSLTARYTDLLRLEAPFDILTNPWAILIIGILVIVEFVADKVPTVDHVSHAVGMVVHPAAGAILFASQQNIIGDIHPLLALTCGLLLAGGVHSVRATVRPIATATTAGIANPALSFLEDMVAVVGTILAILAPLLALLFLGLLLFFALRLIRQLRPRRPDKRQVL